MGFRTAREFRENSSGWEYRHRPQADERGGGRSVRSWFWCSGAFLAVLSCSPTGAAESASRETSWLTDDLTFLAHPALRGREAGTAETRLVAHWLATRMKALGLAPGAGGSYFQPVELTRVDAHWSQSQLTLEHDGSSQSWTHGAGVFVEAGGIPLEALDLPVVDAGFGISAPEHGYDDVAEIDPRGKAVLIRDGEPTKPDGSSAFSTGRISRYGLLATKRALLASRGARLILVTGAPGGRSAFEAFNSQRRSKDRPKLVPRGSAAVPLVVAIEPPIAQRILATPGARVRVRLSGYQQTDLLESNVIGVWPGEPVRPSFDPTGSIVIGAHYDHIGCDQAPDGTLTVYPGADDNASGVAAMLEIARLSTALPPPPRRLVFVAFAAEESGALGSAQYVLQPQPRELTPRAVINLDMVGQNHLDKDSYQNVLLASYSAQSVALTQSLQTAAQAVGVDVRKLPALRPAGRSDDAPFALAKIPAVLLFTGMHPDHDTPRDTLDRLRPEKVILAARFGAALVSRLAALRALNWDASITTAPPSDPWDRPY